VLSLYQSGALKMLLSQLDAYKMDIIAIQEMRWTGDEKLNEPNIVNYIKVKRLAWAWHLMCMNNDRTIKKIFNAKPDGVRRAGRPKLWWEDGVDQDMRSLEVKNWKRVALKRDELTKLLKKARAHHGLSSQWWWWWLIT